jgi:hypothetical protein
MSNQQQPQQQQHRGARLPPTPGNSIITTSSAVTQRHTQNIDVQNNTISTMITTDSSPQLYNNNNINDDTINALGTDLAIQTSQVIENLTEHERSIILDVLTRDENIRMRDNTRIM